MRVAYSLQCARLNIGVVLSIIYTFGNGMDHFLFVFICWFGGDLSPFLREALFDLWVDGDVIVGVFLPAAKDDNMLLATFCIKQMEIYFDRKSECKAGNNNSI